MRLFNLLGFRLFLLVTVILLILTTSVTYLHYHSQMQNYEGYVTEFGDKASKLVLRFTEHAMNTEHEHLSGTNELMNSIASLEGIHRIRIYNKRGTIVYSSDSSEVHSSVNMTNEACDMCHRDTGELIHEPSTRERKRVFESPDGARLLGFVTAIKTERSCSSSNCHSYAEEGSKLGVLDVIFKTETIDRIVESETSELITSNIVITILLSFSVGIFIWLFVHVPVKHLINGTRAVSRGNLDATIDISSSDEIGMLGRSFNTMTRELRAAKEEITRWSRDLEKRVQQKTEELKRTQERILQIEKMASIGTLSATVAHELNNPLSGILTYSKLIQRKLRRNDLTEDEMHTIFKQLEMIEEESARCGGIIKNLLYFSKDNGTNLHPASLNPIVESAVALVSHHLQLQNIHLELQLANGLPPARMDENLMKQALLALLINAFEASGDDGEIRIRTHVGKGGREILVDVSDNGRGIPEEIHGKIFEPFFTTKSEMRGVGLGLSTVYGIVEQHSGRISFESEIDKGTTFTIALPVVPKEVSAA